jgi:hypothetical protein
LIMYPPIMGLIMTSNFFFFLLLVFFFFGAIWIMLVYKANGLN